MQWLGLYRKLQRFNASSVIGLFVLIGAATNGYLTNHPFHAVVAVVVAMLIYPAAVGLNDICDQQIDAINVADMDDRALMRGASIRNVIVVSVVCTAISVAGAFWLGFTIGCLVIAIHLLTALYSLPPAQISRRPLLAVPWLTSVYALGPYCIGINLAARPITYTQVLLGIGLYLLFMSRMIMKDFRDREGDLAGGKVTFLLKFGKAPTIVSSYILATIGLGIVVWFVGTYIGLTVLALFVPQLLAVAASLRLWSASTLSDELVAIGVMARLGNATLLLLLIDLVWAGYGTPYLAGGSAAIVGLAVTNGYIYLRHPDRFVFGNLQAHRLRQR